MWSYQHENFIVHQLPVLRDNYIYMIEAKHSDAMIVIDPALAEATRETCIKLGKPPTHIMNTHHHWDHTDGNEELKKQFNCRIIGARSDASRIPGIDIEVSESRPPRINGLKVEVLEVAGHTSGHIAYLIDDALFCGDTLFGAGCGRLFEGTPAQMHHSLNKLATLPEMTKIYCAHEYTMANLAFAHAIDPDNTELDYRIIADKKKRDSNLPTIPSSIGVEKATNPFLRPSNQFFCRTYAGQHNITEDALSVFTHIRATKDHF